MSLDVLNIDQLTSQRFQGSLFMEILIAFKDA